MKYQLFLAALLLNAFPVKGAGVVTSVADFVSGSDTDGWTVSENSWSSPAFPSEVMAIRSAFSNLSSGVSFATTVSADGKAISIVSSGGASLASVAVDWYETKLATVSDVFVTNITKSSFSASWSAVSEAVGYRVNLYSNAVVGASAGTSIFCETFSNVVQKTSTQAISARMLDAVSDTRVGWTGERLYYSVQRAGTVQIGNTSDSGWLAMPITEDVAGSDKTLKLTAWVMYGASTNAVIELVSGAETNEIATITLVVDEPSVHLLDLPTLFVGDRIIFNSATPNKSCRVIVDAVEIVEGYRAGELVKTAYRTELIEGTGFAAEGLEPVRSWLAVTAVAAEAKDDAEESALAEVNLEEPPRMPILNAVSLADCGRDYAADFSPLAAVTKETDWFNGTFPLANWMGFDENGSPDSAVMLAQPSSARSGLYAWHGSSTNALGLRSTSERAHYAGVAFHNDTDATLSSLDVAYAFVQWGFLNENPQTLRFEYRVSDHLIDVADRTGEWTELSELAAVAAWTKGVDRGGEDCKASSVAATDLAIGKVLPGEYLVIRFVADRVSGCAGFGIADFRMKLRAGAGSLIYVE